MQRPPHATDEHLRYLDELAPYHRHNFNFPWSMGPTFATEQFYTVRDGALRAHEALCYWVHLRGIRV